MQDTELALLIDRLMRTIHSRLQARAAGFDRESVGPGGGIVLMTLADAGQISQACLTQRVARDKSQMTRMMRALQDKGLIARAPSPQDKRVTLVRLTPKGQQIAGELTAAVAEVINEILEPIAAPERALLKSLLARVV